MENKNEDRQYIVDLQNKLLDLLWNNSDFEEIKVFVDEYGEGINGWECFLIESILAERLDVFKLIPNIENNLTAKVYDTLICLKHKQMIELLFQHVQTKDFFINNLFFKAVDFGDMEMTKFLIDDYKGLITAQTIEKVNFYIILNEKLDFLKLMLSENFSALPDRGDIINICLDNRSIDIMKLLIRNKILDVDYYLLNSLKGDCEFHSKVYNTLSSKEKEKIHTECMDRMISNFIRMSGELV
jgi:hypothetical protein